jgi:hypothetical protein
LALGGLGLGLAACAPTPPKGEAPAYLLPDRRGAWKPRANHRGRLPAQEGQVTVEGVGTFSFLPEQIETVRPDIFQPGHFSLFDVLAHLADRGDLALSYHFDEGLGTHVIDALDGDPHWWYQARYSRGWYEPNVFRMDLYPYKDGTDFEVYRQDAEHVEAVHRTFREDVDRLERNGGQVVLPDMLIRSPDQNWAFEQVAVTAHDVRTDILQPGVVTALDAILSLAEQGEFANVELTWYERIASADPVDSYWVSQIGGAGAYGGCGFVYETGPRDFAGFRGSHIHIPADVRVTLSPEYALWFWICLGGGR